MGLRLSASCFAVFVLLSSPALAQRRRPVPAPPSPSEAAQPPQPPQPPMSESDSLARNHFEAGRAYFAEARYEDAAREFSEAFRLSHRLPLLLNLSRALEEADREADAVAALDQWLAESPADDPGRREVTERRTRLVHEASLRAAANQRPVAEPTPPSEPAADEGRSGLFIVGIGALALGGSAGIVAVGTGVAAHAIHSDLEAACDSGGLCPASSASDISRGQALARASTAMTFIGVAAAGAGVVMIVLGRDSHEEPAAGSATFLPWVSPTGGGAELRVSF